MIKRVDAPVRGGLLATFELSESGAGGPPVIAVHGITSNSRGWLAVARALDGRLGMIAVDLRGRGASNGLSGPYGIGSHAEDVIALLDHVEIERTVLVGHSLGAYIVARVAADHPARVPAVVLVDGGLTIPGSERADPQAFIDAFLGPAIARLKMRFESHDAYHDWWRGHPALAGGVVDDGDLVAYADHDLVGEAPELRSSVVEEAVRGDANDLFEMGEPAHRLAMPAKLLCAPRGLLDDPNPMQPPALVQAWASEAPHLREAIPVADVNHYTIVMGSTGATAVADAVVDTVASVRQA